MPWGLGQKQSLRGISQTSEGIPTLTKPVGHLGWRQLWRFTIFHRMNRAPRRQCSPEINTQAALAM